MQHFLNSLFVLLVEPSTAQSKIIANQFEELGISQFVTVGTGEEALGVVDNEQPDLVVCAMFLPDMTGTDLVLEMRANPVTEDTPFMLISSVTSRAELEPIRQAGATAVLPKPFAAADLKRAIHTTMDWEEPDSLQLPNYDADRLAILLVDDSQMARHMISRTLTKMGASNITEAADGSQAVELLQQHSYDLVISDYNMPQMDGHELLVYIRHQSQQPNVPVLMVTTEGDQSKLAALQHEGVSAIMDKPFEVGLVKQVVESVFADI